MDALQASARAGRQAPTDSAEGGGTPTTSLARLTIKGAGQKGSPPGNSDNSNSNGNSNGSSVIESLVNLAPDPARRQEGQMLYEFSKLGKVGLPVAPQR